MQTTMFNKIKWRLKSVLKKKYLEPQILVLNNHNFLLPRWGSGGYPNLEMSEMWMIDLLKNHIKIKPGTFVDVGTNVGQTLLKVKSIQEMEYICFEPNPDCVSYLHDLISINNSLKNVKIIPVGVSDENTLSNFNIYNGPMDSSASIKTHFNSQKAIANRFVALLTIETICKTLPITSISIIKIDVEGAEIEVLKSFNELIKRDLPDILIEVLPVKNSITQRSQKLVELHKIIKSLDYQIYGILKNNDKVQKLEKREAFDLQADLGQCDYFLCARANKS